MKDFERRLDAIEAKLPNAAEDKGARYSQGLKRLSCDELERLRDLLQIFIDVKTLPSAEAEELARLEAKVMEPITDLQAEINDLAQRVADDEKNVASFRDCQIPGVGLDHEAIIRRRERLAILKGMRA